MLHLQAPLLAPRGRAVALPTPQKSMESLVVRGATQHNLKNVSCELPRNQLVVITGPSGSGKSSLAFDTIYAEGQRRYVESLSPYARIGVPHCPKSGKVLRAYTVQEIVDEILGRGEGSRLSLLSPIARARKSDLGPEL